ncbi:unnamed protein product, partial [Allacma fusca]
VFAYEKKQGEE